MRVKETELLWQSLLETDAKYMGVTQEQKKGMSDD